MPTLSYIRESHLQKMKSSVSENVDVYLSNTSVDGYFSQIKSFLRHTSISITPDMKDRVRVPDSDNSRDLENSVTIYESLKNLTPQQATDERVWAYFTHCELREYVQKRWNLNEIPPEKRTGSILTHYFVSGVRGLFRDNAVSRLWWMGHIANRCHHFDINRTLEILLYQSDVRANLLERSSFGMSAEIFSAAIKWLEKSYSGNKLLFERSKFRLFMKHLNRRGGRMALNTLEENQLDKLISNILESDLGLDLDAL